MQVFVAANFLQVTCARVPQLPRPGEIVLASGTHSEAGGKGLNVALGCRRLGAEVRALVGIGRDAPGDGLIALLHAHGISDTHVHRLAEVSGMGMGFIGSDGQNCGAVFAGPNLLLDAAHAEQAQADIGASDWVYGQFETALPAVQRCFELAQAAGVPTLLNPSPWQAIPDALLVLTQVLLVNEVEAAQLLGTPLPADGDLAALAQGMRAQVDVLWSRWPGRLLVVTAGHRGSIAFAPGRSPWLCPAHAVDAIDTLGAGDAFASGLIMALGQGWQDDSAVLAAALQQATACGALMASCAGVLDALPSRATLAQFTSGHPEPEVRTLAASSPAIGPAIKPAS